MEQLLGIIQRAMEEIVAQNGELTPASVQASLAKGSALGAFLKAEATTATFSTAEMVAEIEALNARVNVLTKQKNSLIRRLTMQEMEAGKKSDFSKRALVLALRLSESEENEHLNDQLTGLKKLVQADAGIPELEEALLCLKKMVVSEKGDIEEEEATAAGFATVELQSLRQTYQDFLAELGNEENPGYQRKITELRIRVQAIASLEQLLALRPEISGLIREYAAEAYEERQQAASFILDMSGRLAMMEQHLAGSAEHAQEFRQANQSFHTDISVELDGITDSVETENETLAGLKDQVLSRFKKIKTAIDKKHEADESRLDLANQNLDRLRSQIDKAQSEIERVNAENQDLQVRLETDPLTGANSRGSYNDRIKLEMSASRSTGEPLCLMVLDLDHFKAINDNYGHAVGDKVLAEVSRTVQAVLRDPDFLARYGGEEFVILLPGTKLDNAIKAGERIRAAIAGLKMHYNKKPVPITVSIGMAQFMANDVNPDVFFDRADQALYRAKESGRNRCESAT